MIFNPQHIGLFFGQAAIDAALQARDKDTDVQSAFQWLLANAGDVVREFKPKKGDVIVQHKPQLDLLGELIEAGLRYRFLGDEARGTQAAQTLAGGIYAEGNLRVQLMHLVASAYAFEMLHPLMADDARQQWATSFADAAQTLLNAPNTAYNDKLWQMTLRIVAGVVLEDEALFTSGTEAFKEVIHTDIHPDGYIRPAVQAGTDKTFLSMTQAVTALTLAAEAAIHAGENLWEYEYREVSINTPISYLTFYYYYPERWHWYENLTEDHTRTAFDQFGAFIEIASSHRNPRGVELLLEERRPFFNTYAGGLTSLTHFNIVRRKKFGLFGGLFGGGEG